MTFALQILLAVGLLWFMWWLIRAGWRGSEITDAAERRAMWRRFREAAE